MPDITTILIGAAVVVITLIGLATLFPASTKNRDQRRRSYGRASRG